MFIRSLTNHALAGRIAAGVLGLSAVACGGAGLARTAQHEGDWSAVKEGKRVVILASGACATRMGKTREELARGGGTALDKEPWAKSATSWTIEESWAEDVGDESADVYVKLKENGGTRSTWVYSPKSSTVACVHEDVPAVADAQKFLGKKYVWAPWRSSCTAITGGGPKFPDLVKNRPDGLERKADRVELRSDTAVVALGGGEVLVTPETLSACFAEAGTPDARLPDEVSLALLHVDPNRCEKDVHQGAVHVSCRSTVGAWTKDASGLRGVRRTLGPVHFLGGEPVTGRAFARAVVAIDTGTAQNNREVSLYTAVRQAAADTIQRGDDDVRIVPMGDPAITTMVKVVVKDIVISELKTTQQQLSSTYQTGTREVANPDKASARSQIEQAESMIASKRQECESMSDFDASASQSCVDQCVANSGGSSAALCGFTCKDAGGSSSAKSDCLSAVGEAEQQLYSARSTFDSMPDTLSEPVYGEWPYTRTDYARAVSALIETTTTSALGEKRVSDKLDYVASDYEVKADSAHNVEGHDPKRDFIDTPESIVPNLGERASALAVVRLRESIQIGAIDAALLALRRAGATPKPGYENADAMAFDVVGPRLSKAERYGDGATSLKIGDIALAAGECALVAAVSDNAGAKVTLTAGENRFVDRREKPFATLELCPTDVASGKLPDVQVTGEQVKWALYRTRSQMP